MKLTTSQIDHLFTFTRQHYVEWYDLQSELVDHLANAIETEWAQNPKLTFDEALNKEFKKFGVFGFMDVVEKRQAVLGKKYNGLVWQHFKDFFWHPKDCIDDCYDASFIQYSQNKSVQRMDFYRVLPHFDWVYILRNFQKQ